MPPSDTLQYSNLLNTPLSPPHPLPPHSDYSLGEERRCEEEERESEEEEEEEAEEVEEEKEEAEEEGGKEEDMNDLSVGTPETEQGRGISEAVFAQSSIGEE